MRTTIVCLGMLGLSALALPAQDQTAYVYPPLPLTKLEAIDTNISVVIFKASSDLGAIVADAGTVAVKCKQLTDTSTGHKELGIAIEITPRGQPRDVLLVDYDELTSLNSAIDYLTKLGVEATPLTSFDAAFTTRGGFRIAALGTRSTGRIQFGVRDARINSTPVTFSRDQMSRLSDLINQAKSTLEALPH